MGQSVRASEKGLAIANQARQRRGWTKTSTARWWQDAHTSRATLRRFWRGERIQQDTFIAICHTVGLDDWQAIAELSADEFKHEPGLQPVQIDWGEAPDIEQFYGRGQELQQLQTWILTEAAKLITISGLGGNGKTTLALALAEQLQPEFEGIIWRSLSTLSSLHRLLTDLIDAPVETVDQGVRQLLQKMQNRWLIVLDDIDVDQPEPYLEFLHRISHSRHRSCVLVISRQPLPAQFQVLNRAQQLSLSGLSADAAAQLLQAYGCSGQLYQLKTLARIYGYSPLALKLVAATIQTVFGGQIATFLAQETVILPDPIGALFKQQFEQLEPFETTLIFWLAIWQEPISLCRLKTHLLNANSAEIMAGISRLVHCSLVTRHFLSDQPSFSLQPMVMAWAVDELVALIMHELAQGQEHQTIQNFHLLRSHCLIRPGTDDILGDRILTTLRESYQTKDFQPLSSFMDSWLQQAKQEPPNRLGYLAFNLTILKNMLVNS